MVPISTTRATVKTTPRPQEHLFRVAFLFVAGLLVFAALRAVFVPADFGRFGHYRAGALDDNRARPAAFAGRAVCADCHTDEAAALGKGHHAKLGCETCHGPLARHADDPEKQKPAALEVRALCGSCHAGSVAKPKGFPQIDLAEHGEKQPCAGCHRPHNPEEMP